MKFKVTTNNVVLDTQEELNKGEYNIHTCEFEFSSEYDSLTKKALFTTSFGNTYQIDIINNKCEIPYEVLSAKGDITLGVYGYSTKEDTLELRYSPKPTTFKVDSGSYIEDIDNSSKPTPTELEQLNDRIRQVEDNVGTGLYKEDIIDNLISENVDKVLSANQGRILNENISKANSTIETLSLNVEANTAELEGIKANYITKAVNDLENYYLKSETYTKDEVKSLVDTIPKFTTKVVDTLPTENISDTTIYLVKSGEDEQNIYTEYIYVNNTWEKLGSQGSSVKLDDYYTKEETDTQITNATENIAFNGYKVYELRVTPDNYGTPYTFDRDIFQEALQNLYTNKIKPIFKPRFPYYGDFPYIEINEKDIDSFLNDKTNNQIMTTYFFSIGSYGYFMQPHNGEETILSSTAFRIYYKIDNDKVSITSSNIIQGTINLLSRNNKVAYIPSRDYNPATKKYVDDAIATAIANLNSSTTTE